MLSSLFDLESSQILVTASGNNHVEQINEALSKTLIAMWKVLGIQDIEAIE